MIFEPNMQMKMQFHHGLLFLLYFSEWLRPHWLCDTGKIIFTGQLKKRGLDLTFFQMSLN